MVLLHEPYHHLAWEAGRCEADALIAFTFQGAPQDLDRFRNAPAWCERYGAKAVERQRFRWTDFYEAVADGLLAFRNDRSGLVAALHAIASRVDGMGKLQDAFADGSEGPLRDICPFTVFGTFNRGTADATRRAIAKELADFLGISIAVPNSFEGIPVLDNRRTWYFGYERTRRQDDIDSLWDVFAAAIRYADAGDASASGNNRAARGDFAQAYDEASRREGVGWNLSMGLYWVRPWSYVTLDNRSLRYIETTLGVQVGCHGSKGRCSADDYLAVRDALEAQFSEETCPVHSFPELSLAAWLGKDGHVQVGTGNDPPPDAPPQLAETYSIDTILADGCFLDSDRLVQVLARLREKNNLILQGPPGTGKTWLATRLAWALAGQREQSHVRALQFHPNLSYEDFVRGWRPSGDGHLSLVDGPFLEGIRAAADDPGVPYTVVIEEINRGNPAQIFGEMLTLLEADKRVPSAALELCYRRHDGERVYVPANLHVIGTMNIADRSLALVDLALRRRFAFIDLKPTFGEVWRQWLVTRHDADLGTVIEIEKRLTELNADIAADSGLGPQFGVGHSYVTPPVGALVADMRRWFSQVVETEIGPLLEEYWFDAPAKAQQARQRLLEGL